MEQIKRILATIGKEISDLDFPRRRKGERRRERGEQDYIAPRLQRLTYLDQLIAPRVKRV